MVPFTPLVTRSHYSLMWGTTPIPELCRAARRMGYGRLALTDTDNLYGLWPFLRACRREGIVPIVGAEVTEPATGRRAVCLAATDRGYANLCRLLTRRHGDVNFDLAAAVVAHRQGLVVLTGYPALLECWYAAGVSVAGAMPRRPLPASHALRRTAKKLGVPVAAVPGSFFLHPGDARRHRLMRAIANNTTLSRLNAGQWASDDAWLADPRTYRRRFAVCPEALEATERIAAQITFSGPDFGIVMPPWHSGSQRDAEQCLRRAAYRGARKRYGIELGEALVDRLEHELGIIAKMGFCAYFLIVQEIVAHSPRTCGRGSGAASLVAYCLGITNVCPLKHNLYFERFLNPGRKDPPDIDVDFAWDERDTVLATVLTRYRHHAAMVCSHVLFQPRMAVRETAKVFGLTDGEIGRVSRRMPWHWRTGTAAETLMAALRQRPEMKTLGFADPWPEILGLAQELIGTPRHVSVHPGGVVITPDPIDGYVPVEPAPKGVPIVQWEKDGLEDAGLVKIDLLGNRSLGVIRDAVHSVRTNGGGFDEQHWEPEDDPDTQAAVAHGRTMGCFYIESPAMRLLQQKAAVGDFEHLVIHSSIIRPAANEFIREYIRRLHGGAWDPIHPLLADVLAETFGIMVYQEDVARVAVSLAGFSHAEADGLRKVMSKKDRDHRLRDFYRRFSSGARSRGVTKAQISAVWEMMMSFSGYSFCKPHSASYARVSFQAAYLKVHHPAEFMAAVISNQGGYYSTFAYVSEARRLGLTLRAPDVGRSDIRWTGRGDVLQAGLLSVGGISAVVMERIVDRRQDVPYRSLNDFLDRVRPDDGEVRSLIHCGALDRFAPQGNRAALMWQVAARRKTRAGEAAAGSLFTRAPAGPAPALPPEIPAERLRREFAVLGFLCAHHPMALYRRRLQQMGVVPLATLGDFSGRRVRTAGWLITGKVVRTKHGDPMEFLTFEDETGIVETTFFPAAYRRFCHRVDRGRPYVLDGRVDQDWGAVTLTVDRVAGLELPTPRG